jgi:hypothetical protein
MSLSFGGQWVYRFEKVDSFVPRLNHLAALGRRWGQPGQQHGRLLPFERSWTVRLIRLARVSGFLAEIIQQIHSFFDSAVKLFQMGFKFGSEASAF